MVTLLGIYDLNYLLLASFNYDFNRPYYCVNKNSIPKKLPTHFIKHHSGARGSGKKRAAYGEAAMR